MTEREAWRAAFDAWWETLPTVGNSDPDSVREIEEQPVAYYIAAACWQAAIAAQPAWDSIDSAPRTKSPGIILQRMSGDVVFGWWESTPDFEDWLSWDGGNIDDDPFILWQSLPTSTGTRAAQDKPGVPVALDPRWKWATQNEDGSQALWTEPQPRFSKHYGEWFGQFSSIFSSPDRPHFAGLLPGRLYEIVDGRFVEREIYT